jgi:Flp pilus assembly protein TadD
MQCSEVWKEPAMSYSRTMQRWALTAILLATCGCARWTVWPQANDLETAADGSAEQSLLALRGRPALARRPQDAANATDRHADLAGGPAKPESIPEDLKDLDPSLAIARLSERQGDGDQARRLYSAYLERNPRHPLPHHRLGVMAARSAKFEEAEQHFQAALKIGSPSTELLCDLGYLYYLQDRLQEAEEVLRQACAADPANQAACNNLALVYAGQGEFDKSMRYFRRVNDDAEAHANVAFMLAQHGRMEHSRSAYLRALTLDKSLKTAAKALLQVEETRKAEELAQRRQEHLESQPAAASSDPLLLSDDQARLPQSDRVAAGPMPQHVPQRVAQSLPAAPQASPLAPTAPAYAARSAEAMLMPVPQPSNNQWRQPPAQPIQLAGAVNPLARPQAAQTADYERPLEPWPSRQFHGVTQAVYDAPTTGDKPGDPRGDVRAAAAHWEWSAPHDQIHPAPAPPRSSAAVRIGLSDAVATQPAATSETKGPVRVSLHDAP